MIQSSSSDYDSYLPVPMAESLHDHDYFTFLYGIRVAASRDNHTQIASARFARKGLMFSFTSKSFVDRAFRLRKTNSGEGRDLQSYCECRWFANPSDGEPRKLSLDTARSVSDRGW